MGMAKKNHLFSNDEELIRIPAKYLVLFITSLPMGAFVICVFLCVMFHFDQALVTHCGVSNWLPSVSAAVASFSPERYIWRFMIGLHGAPSFLLAVALRNYLLSSSLWPEPFKDWYRWACNFSCAFHCIETFCLLLLTSVSSDDNLFVHVCSFNGYALSTLLHMLIVTWLFDLSGRRRSTKLGEHSYQYKVFTSIGAVISLGLVIYFYIRHNKYCEPGIYSLFALSEYMLITCNFLFYSTLYYDFKSGILTLISSPSLQQYNLLLNNYDDKKT